MPGLSLTRFTASGSCHASAHCVHESTWLQPLTEFHKMTPAWIVYAWPRILCEAQRVTSMQFAHLSTSVLVHGDAAHPAMGQTLWQGEGAHGRAGVAWDWISLPAGVVAMVDPMALVTNLQFLNPVGEVLAPM